ncbi:hypothetical protein DDZ14_16075 [Maritimibacter sp. 55A14]|uniref:hypothetical protein n=1 Tax=Maritimibacter sp. 55A14 TaxID=2174844 RepID=UPI000D614BC1|nr:hypothetical protein [Maritimibacter sp. 55A14]PWE29958.1 hypothetical protein DDZ14_16075 [Maritimibacter sp. 55A14]
MIDVTFHDAAGRIAQIARLRNVDDANATALALGRFWVPGRADLAADYVDVVAGTILPRPAIPSLPAAGTVPLAIDLSVYPSGSVVSVLSEAGDALTISDMGQTLNLTGPGLYTVAVDPPFPHLPVQEVIPVD